MLNLVLVFDLKTLIYLLRLSSIEFKRSFQKDQSYSEYDFLQLQELAFTEHLISNQELKQYKTRKIIDDIDISKTKNLIQNLDQKKKQ